MKARSLVLCVLWTACGGTETVEPALGSLHIAVSVAGVDIDRDGVLISVDSVSVVIPANGEYEFEGLAAGVHTVTLSGAPANCTSNGPLEREVQIEGGATGFLTWSLTCTLTPLANGNLIAFSKLNADQSWDLWLMNSDGTGARILRESPGVSETAPAWSPDGQSIIFVNAFAIGRVDRSGGGYVQLAPYYSYAPSVSPDGNEIVFTRDSTGQGGFDIWVMNIDGSTPHALTSDSANEDHPSWSPDGSRIVFERGSALYVMNADGTNVQRLTPDEVIEAASPSWSPDGATIAFVSRPGSAAWHIYTIKPDGTGLKPLTSGLDNDVDPSWSPDGSRIIFGSTRGYPSPGSIWSMRPDGTDMRRLSTGTWEADPAWGP